MYLTRGHPGRRAAPDPVARKYRGVVSLSRKLCLEIYIIPVLIVFGLIVPDIVISEQNAPHDNGTGLDQAPGDGIYTTNGLWDIEAGDVVELNDLKIMTTASLVVRGGGTLNLTNVTLYMGTSSGVKPIIDVHNGGEMNLNNCTVAPARGPYAPTGGFAFQFKNGARGLLEDCRIWGVNTTVGPIDEGFVIESSSVTVNSTTFNVSRTGITVRGCSPMLHGNTFRDNPIGLSVRSTAVWPVMRVDSCTFMNNTMGVYITGVANPNIYQCQLSDNTEGIRCENMNFFSRYPTIRECTITGSDRYGINITGSRAWITDTTITGGQVGFRVEGCRSLSFPTVNGSTIEDCEHGLLVNDSIIDAVTLKVQRCPVSVTATNGSDMDLHGLLIPGGSGTDIGVLMNSSVVRLEESTIGPVKVTYTCIGSRFSVKNSTASSPFDRFLFANSSNITFINSTAYPVESRTDNDSFVIDGGFHNIRTMRKNGSAAGWVDLSIRGKLYEKNLSTDYFGRLDNVLLHHKRIIGEGKVDYSYGENHFTAIYKEGENHFTVNVTQGMRVDLTLNAPPTAENVLITPPSPRTTDALLANWSFSDLDEEDLPVESILRWHRNDVRQAGLDNITTVGSNLTEKGERWYFTLRVSDGDFWSGTYRSEPVHVENTPPKISGLRDMSIRQGGEIDIPFTVSDPDQDTLEIVLIADVEWGRLSADEESVLLLPPIDSTGQFKFDVRASDGTLTVNESFIISVIKGSGLRDISVIITNSTGAPISGANISIGDATAITDGNGTSTIVNISGAMRTLTVWKEGYWAVDRNLILDGAAENPVIVELALVPLPAKEFTMTFLDTKGRGIAGANLSLDLISFDVPGLEQPSDSNASVWIDGYSKEGAYIADQEGRVHFDELYPGIYRITVRRKDFESYDGILTVRDDNESAYNLAVYGEFERLKGQVSGTVTSASGKPLTRIEVELIPNS